MITSCDNVMSCHMKICYIESEKNVQTFKIKNNCMKKLVFCIHWLPSTNRLSLLNFSPVVPLLIIVHE